MNEDHKIKEARYFLAKLAQPELEHCTFAYELSAFLTAARSALQYALDEVKSKPGGQTWYDGQIQAFPVIGFLRDKRDVSVHATPVIPNPTIHVKLEEHAVLGDSFSVTVKNPDGTEVRDQPHARPTEQMPLRNTLASSNSSVTYHFSDWTGTEDVVTLCSCYIQQICDIVSDGRTRLLIS